MRVRVGFVVSVLVAVAAASRASADDRSAVQSLAVGDVDGDGKPDVVVGTPGANGKTGAVLWTTKGAAKECLGEGLYPCADGDGVADVVALAPGAAVKGTRGLGYVRFLLGKTGAAFVQINPLSAKKPRASSRTRRDPGARSAGS